MPDGNQEPMFQVVFNGDNPVDTPLVPLHQMVTDDHNGTGEQITNIVVVTADSSYGDEDDRSPDFMSANSNESGDGNRSPVYGK